MYMIHHVFLPPKLPDGGKTRDLATEEQVLLRTVLETLDTFADFSNDNLDNTIKGVHSMIDKLCRLTDDRGGIHEKLLLESFTELSSKGMLRSISGSNFSLLPSNNTNRWHRSSVCSCPECRCHNTERMRPDRF